MMHDRYADPDPADCSDHISGTGDIADFKPISNTPRTRALHAHASPRQRSATHRAIGDSWAIGQGVTRPGASQRVRAAGGVSTYRQRRTQRMARKTMRRQLAERARLTQWRAEMWMRAHPLTVDWWRACLLIGAMLLFVAGCWAIGVLLAATGTWQ